MNVNDYLKDWHLFISHIISLHNSGKSDEEISKNLVGKKVFFIGTIKELKLSEVYSPGIAFDMPAVDVILKGGIKFRADYAFVAVDENTKMDWKACRVGNVVKYCAHIKESLGPFPAARVSIHEELSQATFMINLANAQLQKE